MQLIYTLKDELKVKNENIFSVMSKVGVPAYKEANGEKIDIDKQRSQFKSYTLFQRVQSQL